MNISTSYYCAKGERTNNEDAVSLLDNNGILAIVADGLGGHANGEVASAQAVSTINSYLQSAFPDEDLLIEAVQQASQDIYALRDNACRMHSTVAVLWLDEYAAIAAHVGDSRIYQFRDRNLIFQSMDHSVAQIAVLVGEIQPMELRNSKDRNRLIRVLGDANPPKVDCESLSIRPKDRFLLCSDGFWEAVTEADMVNTIHTNQTAEEWLEAMRSIVERMGKPNQDNHTAIAIIVN